MTLRARWAINRERRQLGLPEVDQNGQVMAPMVRKWKPLTEEELAGVYEPTRASYDPTSQRYIANQGD
jgi:hypothetical protein